MTPRAIPFNLRPTIDYEKHGPAVCVQRFDGSRHARERAGQLFQVLRAKAASNGIGLVPDLWEFVARAPEVAYPDGASVLLQVVNAPGHGLSSARIFVAGDNAFEPAGEALLFAANDEAGQEPQLCVLLTPREVREARFAVENILADVEVAVRAGVAVDELSVFACAAGAGHGLPGLRRKVDRVAVRFARVCLVLRRRRTCDREERKNEGQNDFRVPHSLAYLLFREADCENPSGNNY
jgi:hypothetical protein